MKRLFLAAALALSACGPIASNGTLPAPADVAQHTTADETVRQVSEEAYKLLRVTMEAGVDSGLLKGAAAAKAQDINRRAYAALLLIRKAYDTFNAADLITASRDLASLVHDAAALVKG